MKFTQEQMIDFALWWKSESDRAMRKDCSARAFREWQARAEQPPAGTVTLPVEKLETIQVWLECAADGIDAEYGDGSRTPNSIALKHLAAEVKAMLAAGSRS